MNEKLTLYIGYAVIAAALFAFLVRGIYLVVKGVVYYKSSAQVQGITVSAEPPEEIPDTARDEERDKNEPRKPPKINIEFEYNGERINAEPEENFAVKRIGVLEPGQEITVWYCRQFRKCTADRKGIIIGGISMIVSVLVLCIIIAILISGVLG